MEWRPGVVEHLGYYVYLLIDPRDDRIFYVGKGTGSRCFSHVAEARRTIWLRAEMSVNAIHLELIEGGDADCS